MNPGDVVTCVYDAKLGALRAAKPRETKGRRGDFIWLGGDAYAHPDLAALLVPISELVHHPRNPRRGDVATIAQSIRVNGLYRPVYVQRATGWLLAGNHTTRALRDELHAELAPRIEIDADDDTASRILFTDNRSADLGGYDDALLLESLRELNLVDPTIGLLGTGYDADAVDQLARFVAAADLGAVDFDAAWVGMPDYSSQDQMQEPRVSIRFRDDAAADAFFQLIGKPRATVVFWPEPWLPQSAFTAADGPRVELDEGDANADT